MQRLRRVSISIKGSKASVGILCQEANTWSEEPPAICSTEATTKQSVPVQSRNFDFDPTDDDRKGSEDGSIIGSFFKCCLFVIIFSSP